MQSTVAIIEKQSQVIRPELNIERWPIWMPAQSHYKATARTFTDTKRQDNNSSVSSTVKVSPLAEYGNLTTEDEKVWYGLIKLWEDAGKPTELVFSLRKLAEILDKKWGMDTLTSLKKSLHRLRATYFVWTNSYTIRDEKGKDRTLELLDTFTLLVELKLAKLSINHSTKESCKIRFHEYIESNLRNNYTKPTDLSTIIRFKSGIALLLYKHLEWMLYKRDVYSISSKELFNYLRLEGAEYSKPSVRKRLLEKAIIELNNNIRMYGLLLKVSLQRNKYDEDWLLVAEKSAQLELVLEDKASGVTTTPSDTNSSHSQHNDDEAETIVRYFLDRFVLIRRTQPQPRELEQARVLIEKHQITGKRARFFIDFAKEQALDTGFDIRNFGGVLQYVERWLSHQTQPQSQTQPIAYGTFTPKQCARCKDSSSFLSVIDSTGKRSALKCPHDEQVLALKLERDNLRLL